MNIKLLGFLRLLRELHCSQKAERGIALMLVLWVLTLLSIMVFEFCYTMRIEATITRNFKEGERSYFLAQAGIHRAIIEIVRTKRTVKKFEGSKESMVKDEEKDVDDEEEQSDEWKPREEPYTFPLEDGECEVNISDEGSKINLNWIAKNAKTNRKLLTDIFENSFGLEGEERDIIIDSIIDWVDKDHNHLMNGAEDEYYESLEDPYECRDGDFVVTEELLLVRGVTEDMYYGRNLSSRQRDELMGEAGAYPIKELEQGLEEAEERPLGNGLSELFTVFSDKNSIKININDAPYGLLMSVSGMTDDVAQRIIELRREEEFENIRDARLMELPNYNQIVTQITLDPTDYYRIEARGRVDDSSVARTVSAVVKITPKEKDKYKVVYWQEGV